MAWSQLANIKGPPGTTDASGITTGTLSAARLPNVLSTVRTASTLSIDASVSGNNVNYTATGNVTVNVPTNGADHQVLQVVILASAAITVTFNASLQRLTGIDASYTVPAGKKMRIALRRSDLGSVTWIVEAVGITQ
jgi:hypothetical protein